MSAWNGCASLKSWVLEAIFQWRLMSLDEFECEMDRALVHNLCWQASSLQSVWCSLISFHEDSISFCEREQDFIKITRPLRRFLWWTPTPSLIVPSLGCRCHGPCQGAWSMPSSCLENLSIKWLVVLVERLCTLPLDSRYPQIWFLLSMKHHKQHQTPWNDWT